MRLVPSSLTAVCAAFLLIACSRAHHPVSVYNIGEKATVGHMVYTVFETQWLTQLPQQPTPRIPKNRFFLVRLSAVNGGGGDVMLPEMTIEDDNGNAFQALNNGEGIPQWIGSLRKVPPAEAAQGNVVFDAPPRHYRLRVTDENGDESALVDIPLSFNSEVPREAPVPNSEKGQ
jgi:hypothetical protein